MKKTTEFQLFRLNLVDGDMPLLEMSGNEPMRTDDDIIKVMLESSKSEYDNIRDGKTTQYRWSIRGTQVVRVGEYDEKVIVSMMARSTLAKEGDIVTDYGITSGESTSSPPLAELFGILIFLKRHLVAVEYNSLLHNAGYWREAFVKINAKAAGRLRYSSYISVDPVVVDEDIFKIFRSFEKVTRLKVSVRIPNPELDEYTKELHEEMVKNGIREYIQDMKNKRGINTQRGMRPHTTLRMAEAGYKDGDIIIAGIKNGKQEITRTGQDASSVSTNFSKELLHSALTSPQSYPSISLFSKISEMINEKYESVDKK